MTITVKNVTKSGVFKYVSLLKKLLDAIDRSLISILVIFSNYTDSKIEFITDLVSPIYIVSSKSFKPICVSHFVVQKVAVFFS